jgi:pimeloyl-ACP methyl ester carboxylesterase
MLLVLAREENGVALVAVNGVQINYEMVGTGAPLVYLAGTRFDSAKDKAVHLRDYATGFQSIVPDLRGMGGSTHTAQAEPEDWVRDLAGLLDALGTGSAHLAAETLGTRIAVRFAADYPNYVRSLILDAPIAYSSPQGDEQRRRNSGPDELPEDRRKSLEFHQGSDWQAVNAFYLGMHARPDFHQYYDLRQAAPRVTSPALIIRGDIDDPVHPVQHSVELHALIAGSWLAIVPNTGFNALLGRPNESWDLIRRFTKEAAC